MSPKEIPTPAISYEGQNALFSSGLPEGNPAERESRQYENELKMNYLVLIKV
jgi:hypothetical protein